MSTPPKQPKAAAAHAFKRAIMAEVDVRFGQFKQDILGTFRAQIGAKTDPLEQRISALEAENHNLVGENERLHQALLKAQADGDTAIKLCTEYLEKLDLVVNFALGSKKRIKKQFVAQGKEFKDTWRMMQLLDSLENREESRVDGADITNLVKSGFVEEVRGLLKD